LIKHPIENNIEPTVSRFPSKRIVLVTLKILLVAIISVAFAGWFIGAIPAYPHMREWKVCSYPKIISSSLYDIERKELFMAVCFNTSDSWKQVAEWYEPFGWTDKNALTDDIGTPVIGRINVGRVVQIIIKRDVLFSVYEPVDVKVVAAYEIRSDIFSGP
jgi:hypothetical protein